jgi:ABC-type transporter Mla subunit MlaD
VERKGSSNLLHIVVLAVVLAATFVTGTLLGRTMLATDRINLKAKTIARTGQGINSATDSVVQLSRTNETALSILASTQPLAGDLSAMVEQAKALDSLSGSLDASTGAINGTVARLLVSANGMSATAADINATTKKIAASSAEVDATTKKVGDTTGALNATAKGINASLAGLLDVTRKVDNDVKLINQRLDTGLALDKALKVDTGNLLNQVGLTQRYAACLDRKVLGSGADSHC